MGNSELHKDHRGRMRERFRRNGLSAFEDHEVLEMILFSAIPRRNTNDIAHELLGKFGDLASVLSAEKNELCSVGGIGETSAQHLLFLGELYSEVTASVFEKIPINTDESAGMYSVLLMGTAPADSSAAVYLDKSGVRISQEWLYRGKRQVRESLEEYIPKRAKEEGAASVILMHNHKHEPQDPSPDDILITEKLRKNAEAIGIGKVWHVIVSDDGYLHM